MFDINDFTDILTFGLRVVFPFLTLIIIFVCFFSLRWGRREERALIILDDEDNKVSYPVLYWENSIGRSKTSDIVINDKNMAMDHAVLLRRSDGWFIADTGSKTGVYVNGVQTLGRCNVAVGDLITCGGVNLVLKRVTDKISDSENRMKIKTPKKTHSPHSVLILSLMTLYIALMAVEGTIHSKDSSFVLPAIGFIIVMWLFFVISKGFLKRSTFELESLAMLLCGTGIILAAAHNQKQAFVQLAAMCVGILIYCFMIWFIELPDRVMKWHIMISILAILLLASSIVLGQVQNGAKNWIVIGPISIQPSEFAKIAYIFVGASTLDVLQTKKSLTTFIIVTAICVGLLFLMSDFGTALIFFVTFLLISFMRSGNFKTIILALSAAVIGVIMILYFKPYIADRFKAWGHVWEYADTSGYQQVNSMIYTASGGFFGMGLSKGNLQYLFASENDLVFALVCEEIGILMALLMTIIISGMMIYARTVTTRSRSTFYSITACAAGGLLVFQTALNIFGVVDLLPLTGVTLPFVSYGGSSMAACWGLLAFIKAADERTYLHKKIKIKRRAIPEDNPENEKEEITEI